MALETQYVVGVDPENGHPVIFRSITVDGVEVSRGSANFAEIKAAYPVIIEEYFDAVAAWARDLSSYFDEQSEFTANNYIMVHKSSRFFYDFMQKFDYAEIADSTEFAHMQEPEPVVEELDPVEETQEP
jgi:hypothetical protein